MKFTYNKEKINTGDVVEISIADLRDLIQSVELNSEDRLNEMNYILSNIIHKNKLESGVFGCE